MFLHLTTWFNRILKYRLSLTNKTKTPTTLRGFNYTSCYMFCLSSEGCFNYKPSPSILEYNIC